MARPAGEPLTRISINLPTDDYDTLKETYPAGYQLKIRELIQEHCRHLRALTLAMDYDQDDAEL